MFRFGRFDRFVSLFRVLVNARITTVFSNEIRLVIQYIKNRTNSVKVGETVVLQMNKGQIPKLLYAK